MKHLQGTNQLCRHLFITPSILVLIIFTNISLAGSFIEPNNYVVNECSPCKIKLAAGSDPIYIFSEFENVNDSHRKLISLKLKSSSNILIQKLTVSSSDEMQNNDYIFIGSVDLNFDGFNDLYLINDSSKISKAADYWIYNKADKHYIFLGNFPIFKINQENGYLISKEVMDENQHRMITNTYFFKGYELILQEQLEVKKLNQHGSKVEILRRRVNDSMIDVSKKWFRTP